MREYLTPFKWTELDVERLRAEAHDDEGYKEFVDPLSGKAIAKWLIKYAESGYGKEIEGVFQRMFSLPKVRARFYRQAPDFALPPHVDRGGVSCGFNFLLSPQTPVVFEGERHLYRHALFNTSRLHAVPVSEFERVLFKISVFDTPYEEVRDVLEAKIRLRQDGFTEVLGRAQG